MLSFLAISLASNVTIDLACLFFINVCTPVQEQKLLKEMFTRSFISMLSTSHVVNRHHPLCYTSVMCPLTQKNPTFS